MLSPDLASSPVAVTGHDLLLSVLENTETGVAVVDQAGQAVYVNATARRILRCEQPRLPAWTDAHLGPMLAELSRSRDQVIERWAHSDVTLRVRARPLDASHLHIALELSVARAAGVEEVAELLARSLVINRSDARLLELLWRGQSNDEIADVLGVRLGTVKSRLFRLYQKLGVRRRPAAVLRAQEVIAS